MGVGDYLMTKPHPQDGSPRASTTLPRLPYLALTRYLAQDEVEAAAVAAGWEGRRRVFDPWVLQWTLLAQALGGNLSQARVVGQMSAALDLGLNAHSGAYCRARQQFPAGVPERLTYLVAD